jgi:putative PIN family toxin of toxin-antitoxin system
VRVILDTNVLISSLIAPGGTTDAIVQAWRTRTYTLLNCDEQIEELRECFARTALVPTRIRRSEAGRLINLMRVLAVRIARLPTVTRSPDPDDDFLLALTEAGKADYLVTGDKAGLLPLRTHRGTRIVTARVFVGLV